MKMTFESNERQLRRRRIRVVEGGRTFSVKTEKSPVVKVYGAALKVPVWRSL